MSNNVGKLHKQETCRFVHLCCWLYLNPDAWAILTTTTLLALYMVPNKA